MVKKATDKEKLLQEYVETKNIEIRNQIIIEYAYLIKIIASKMSIHMGYVVEPEELESDGIFGLIDAIDKFTPSMNVKFETYASTRIRGSILDAIRKRDHISRESRLREREVNKFVNDYKSMNSGHLPSDDEIANHINMDIDKYRTWSVMMIASSIDSLDGTIEAYPEFEGSMSAISDNTFLTPEENIDKQDLTDELKNALSKLTENEQKVITLYYYDDLTLKEISIILNVSEGRVSQLHSKALKKLKNSLHDYFYLFI